MSTPQIALEVRCPTCGQMLRTVTEHEARIAIGHLLHHQRANRAEERIAELLAERERS